jgi:hypothetical protein
VAKGDFVDSLDHPIVFLVLITVGVVALAAIFVWLFKAAGWPGPAMLFQHP